MEEKLYHWIVGDGDEKPGTDITDEAVEVVPQNFGRQVLAFVALKTGDQLSSPGLILSWLLTALGAPAAAVGMLVPVRESGSLLPQLILGGALRRYPIRKWFWVVGSILQGTAVAAMGVVALTLEGAAAGWSIVGLLAIFSLSRGITSITSKDILGKTIPRRRRGRLSGLSASIAGWIAVGVGIFFALNPAEELPTGLFAGLLFVAGSLWLFSAWRMSAVVEFPSSTDRDSGIWKEAIASLRFLRDDPVFLRFCIARALLASTVLSMPFYVVLAHGATGGLIASFGLLMIAGSLSKALSGATWGRLSDSSSRKTLAVAGLCAGLVGLLTAGLAGLDPGKTGAVWMFGVLFFLIGLSHTGIRMGRSTYLVDHANAGNRAQLVAVSNTLMGVVLLLSGSFGLLADALGERIVIAVFAGLGIAGSLLAFTLPEVE